MARKVNRTLAAAAAAAITAVYATGYVWTQPSQRVTGAQSAAPTSAAATTIARLMATPTPSAVPQAGAAAAYRDGSYTGTGSSRRGTITATVTIQQGRVSAVQITHATTYYPISDIARLPGQVVQRQSANVDFVSGATDSSQAFRGAVSQALAQARAA